MKYSRLIVFASFLSILFAMSSCVGLDDGPRTYYTYEQYVRFDDTNEVIHAIYYPQANLMDSIKGKQGMLKVSENFPTKAVVYSEHFTYTFTFNKKFTFSKSSYNGPRRNDYEKTYDGFEVQESNAIETKLIKSQFEDTKNYSGWGYHYFVQDIVVVK
ncbi:MAG: hypothetical protein K9I36_07695 [Bacteroidia bacterium]|nr:hypothetical protein [Bacteroidia bacterium]